MPGNHATKRLQVAWFRSSLISGAKGQAADRIARPGPWAATEYEGGVWLVRQSGGQDSNVMSAMARADAFAIIPVGVGTPEAGRRSIWRCSVGRSLARRRMLSAHSTELIGVPQAET